MAGMSKTPEEIKKGLECCRTPVKCECCPYQQECDLPFGDLVMADAFSLIQRLERDKAWASENYDLIREENKRLEAQNAELLEKVKQLERERDAKDICSQREN